MFEVTTIESWNGLPTVTIYKFDDVATKDQFVRLCKEDRIFYVWYPVKQIKEVNISA
jgi:hypothetical protein